jgi:hypothetical protein
VVVARLGLVPAIDAGNAQAGVLQMPLRKDWRMRLKAFLLCSSLAACSSVSQNSPSQNAEQPPEQKVLEGARAAATQSHFEPPFEVSDLIRTSPNNTPQWMVCVRSAKSEESKRITYSAFFNTTAFVSARYSAVIEPCATETYHPLKMS